MRHFFRTFSKLRIRAQRTSLRCFFSTNTLKKIHETEQPGTLQISSMDFFIGDTTRNPPNIFYGFIYGWYNQEPSKYLLWIQFMGDTTRNPLNIFYGLIYGRYNQEPSKYLLWINLWEIQSGTLQIYSMDSFMEDRRSNITWYQ